MSEIKINIERGDGVIDTVLFSLDSLSRFTARFRGRGTEPAGEREPIMVPEGVLSINIEGVNLIERTSKVKADSVKRTWVTEVPIANVTLSPKMIVTGGNTPVYLEMSVRDNPPITSKNPLGSHVLRFRLVPSLPAAPATKASAPYVSLGDVSFL